MNGKDKKILYCYQLLCLIFLFLTTKYLNIYDIIHVGNQADSISYTEISKHFPKFPNGSDIIIQNVAQRFLIPYIAGFGSSVFNLDLLLVFKVLTIVFIYIYVHLISLIINKLKLNLRESILLFSFLIFNPYIVRYHIFNPVQSHDMLFFCLCILFVYSVIEKKFILNIFTTTLTIFLRQTSIALFFASFIYLYFNKKIKLMIFLCLIYCLGLVIIIFIGKYISVISFPFSNVYGIFLYDFTQIEILIKWSLLPVVSFFPLILFFFSKLKKNINIKTILIFLIPCLMMIGQPYLGGPLESSRNLIRITTLSYPILVILMFYCFDLRRILNNNLIFYFYTSCLFMWSIHPTFSKYNLFSFLRF